MLLLPCGLGARSSLTCAVTDVLGRSTARGLGSYRELGFTSSGKGVTAPGKMNSGGSGSAHRPPTLFADCINSAHHAGFTDPLSFLSYRKCSGIFGSSQTTHRPPPEAAISVQENMQLSPRRSFAVITV